MRFLTKNAEETVALAEKLAERLTGGEIILLNGDLGAGKTTFTKGIAAALGVKETIQSPTFTVMREYSGKLKLYHIDMYRIEKESELCELGVEECFDGRSVTVIEWNKMHDLKGKTVNIDISYISENERVFNIECVTDRLDG